VPLKPDVPVVHMVLEYPILAPPAASTEPVVPLPPLLIDIVGALDIVNTGLAIVILLLKSIV